MSAEIKNLTGRVLLLVAHADDESVGYGALLQRMQESVVVIATDGAPEDSYFWNRYGSRKNYAAVRREEAKQAMSLAGVQELVLLAEADDRLVDQRLFLNLAAAYAQLERLVARIQPEAIATLAYEGGHPDHDSCSLLGTRLGKQFRLPVWEAPLYHRAGNNGEPNADGAMHLQEFVRARGGELSIEISEEEAERKRAMCLQYTSQGNCLETFDVRREVVRPQVQYDYAQPPHQGRTNYEHWEWWMSVREVSAKFLEFLESKV
jgi:LmbE family N-acetylglucosaminyl deacetylase